MSERKGRQKRVYTTGDHCDDCELHMYNPALARDLCGNIAAAALFYHLAYNIKSRLANGEVDKFKVPWVKTSYNGILRFMSELTSTDQVKNLINILVDQGLIIKAGSNLRNAYTLSPLGYKYAKDRQTLGNIPTMEQINKSVKDFKVKKFVKTNDPRVKEVIDYFNSVAGNGEARFGMGKTNTGLVATLLNKGYSPEIIKKVVKYKCEEFMGTKYEYRARPSSILGELFEIWLRQLEEDPNGSKAKDRRLEYSREPVVYTRKEEKAFEAYENLVRDYFGIDDEPNELPFK
jgi:uncharacterized phage protein (TIGR02220 family)|nr:MAG TPA: hypothetical protein [Caudoviricetes sp.]